MGKGLGEGLDNDAEGVERTLSRASRRPWPSTRPTAAAARSSCRTRADVWCVQGGRGPWAGTPGRAPDPPALPPALSAPSPNRFGEVLRGLQPSSSRAAGQAGGLGKPVCLDPPHKQARLAPSTRVQPTRDTPWLPPLLAPSWPGGFGVTQWALETGSVWCVLIWT